eukprot:TRINITY_DN8560_c0_g1_i1.p1 TRINITY_DN8560_c0_g1~~TRINITY_DN8560_c0_g1_i1.p1  ORF type:complete len:204 (-),score=75.51 TRINITY_DN8560_c0_g1_i1:123-656(-)
MSSSSRWTPSRYVQYGGEEEARGDGQVGYVWTQTPDDLTVTLTLPPDLASLRAKQLAICMKTTHLQVGGAGKVVLEGELQNPINLDQSTWVKEGATLEIILGKGIETKGDEPGQWWPCVIKGHTQIDVKGIEGSKYLDESLLKKIWEKQQEEKAAKANEKKESKASEEEKKDDKGKQ